MALRWSRFGAFLARSMTLIHERAPAHFERMRAALYGITVSIRVGEEPPVMVAARATPDWIRSEGDAGATDVTAAIGDAALSDILAGWLGIENALFENRLVIRGPLDHVLAFHEALVMWIHAAFRCPGFPSLYRDFRSPPRPAPKARQSLPARTNPTERRSHGSKPV